MPGLSRLWRRPGLRTAGDRNSKDSRPILELRIHGVNNTSPAGTLELPTTAIRMTEGDDLASFWAPTVDGQAALRATDPGLVPAGITREAYSWGGLARNSVGGTGRVGRVAASAARFGWTLLLPFSLLNVAYWSRRVTKRPAPGRSAEGRSAADLGRRGWRDGAGAAWVRVAALLLTLLVATTGCVIFLDLLSVQCYANPTATCSKIPSFLNFLGGWDPSRRLALMSFVPVAAVALLYYLTIRTTARFTLGSSPARTWVADGHVADAFESTPRWPILSTRGFWTPVRSVTLTALLHFGAVMVLVSVLTAWHTLFGRGSACKTTSDLTHGACWHQVGSSGGLLVEWFVLISGILLFALILALIIVGSEDAPDVTRGRETSDRRRPATLATGAACLVVFLIQMIVLAVLHTPASTPRAQELLGISAVPAILIILTLTAAMILLSARSEDRIAAATANVAAGLVFAFTLVGASFCPSGSASAWVLRALSAMVLLVRVLLCFRPATTARRAEAFRGCAPSVFTLIALLFEMLLSSAVVAVVGNLLNGSNSVASLIGGPASLTAVRPVCPVACPAKTDALLRVPLPYMWFGASLPAAVLLLGGVAAWVLVKTRSARSGFPESRPPPPDGTRSLADYPSVHAPLARAEWFASLTHRVERYVSAIALIGGIALTVSVSVAASGWAPHSVHGIDAFWEWLLSSGMWVLATMGLAVVGMIAAAPSGSTSRPFGLLWDLVCFLPKTAHPFGPPCYAERVVPEIAGRVEEWLAPHDPGTVADPNRRVVLSAHSLGAVLATAYVFATAPQPGDAQAPAPGPIGRIALLTYGSQQRAYFGRIFPELLGPDVLGSQPCRAPGWTTRDPWRVDSTEPEPVDLREGGLRCLLGTPGGPDINTETGRWLNLWHRSDYIGFPVVGYTDSDVDRYADEIDDSRYLLAVLTHSDYPRTATYADALATLIDGSEGRPTPSPGPTTT